MGIGYLTISKRLAVSGKMQYSHTNELWRLGQYVGNSQFSSDVAWLLPLVLRHSCASKLM